MVQLSQQDYNAAQAAYARGFSDTVLNSGYAENVVEQLWDTTQQITQARDAVAYTLLDQAEAIRRS